jgi:hypothetical protein
VQEKTLRGDLDRDGAPITQDGPWVSLGFQPFSGLSGPTDSTHHTLRGSLVLWPGFFRFRPVNFGCLWRLCCLGGFCQIRYYSISDDESPWEDTLLSSIILCMNYLLQRWCELATSRGQTLSLFLVWFSEVATPCPINCNCPMPLNSIYSIQSRK